jgi:uncharacterized protein (TIGR03435 family)
MTDTNEMNLVREFAECNSERAFAGLVQQHVNLVYSVALRYLGNSQDAQDVTQTVFIILAKKAASLRHRNTLTGWLYEATRLTARQFIRTRSRQLAREQEAYMQSNPNESNTDSVWRQLAPFLEEAMSRLSEPERAALALRFFENKSGAETAALLGIKEPAAHKRVTRALEKLRKFCVKRGVNSTTSIIAGAISANSVQVAPAVLSKSITTVAMAKGAASSTSTLTLIKGAMKLMAWAKVQTAVVIGAGVLLAAGTATVTIKQIQKHRDDDSWRDGSHGLQSEVLDQGRPQLRILPTESPRFVGYDKRATGDKSMGVGAPLNILVGAAYGFSSQKVIFSADVPTERYDFIANLPSGNKEALQQEIKKQFGLVGHPVMVETNVLLLELRSPNAPGLIPSTQQSRGTKVGNGEFKCWNMPIEVLANNLNRFLGGKPVVDETNLKGTFDIDLTWQNPEDLRQVLFHQLGLEFVAAERPVEMLAVEKAN